MVRIWVRLSDKDLDFLIETVRPEVIDKLKLRQIIREDESFALHEKFQKAKKPLNFVAGFYLQSRKHKLFV